MRITLDTNQLVKALMRPPGLATFIMAWEAGRFGVVGSIALLDEYRRVLIYPDIAKLVYPELLRAFQSHLARDIEIVDILEEIHVCRDPDDNKVIATAIFGSVDYLVTEDNDLKTPEIIALLKRFNIAVITMEDLVKTLG